MKRKVRVDGNRVFVADCQTCPFYLDLELEIDDSKPADQLEITVDVAKKVAGSDLLAVKVRKLARARRSNARKASRSAVNQS